MKTEFRVRWEGDFRKVASPRDRTGRINWRARTPEEKQVHRMRMLYHLLKTGGFKIDRTEPDGTQVFVKEEPQGASD